MWAGSAVLPVLPEARVTEGASALPVHSTLDRLREGVTAVLGAPAALNPTVLRLLEMGMTPGTEVTITRRAPGGDPIEIRVRGTRLCVRRADAASFPVWHEAKASAPRQGG